MMKLLQSMLNKIKQWGNSRINFRSILIISKLLIVFLVLCSSIIIIRDEIIWQSELSYEYEKDEGSDFSLADSNEDCNVLGLTVHGDITTYHSVENEGVVTETASENIVNTIESLAGNRNVKAILLEVDSYGGSPIGGEEIANAMLNINKPTVAWIRAYGISAAYLAASGADTIIASENSEIGGIAIAMSYLDYEEQNRRDGANFNSLTTGKFKDSGNPNKVLTIEERNLFKRDLDIMHDNFVRMIAANRAMELSDVSKLADGSTMLGKMALDNGLIDEIGGHKEVKEYLASAIGERISICWY